MLLTRKLLATGFAFALMLGLSGMMVLEVARLDSEEPLRGWARVGRGDRSGLGIPTSASLSLQALELAVSTTVTAVPTPKPFQVSSLFRGGPR
jgi:hypothetical protein